jgi:hypothetical protein
MAPGWQGEFPWRCYSVAAMCWSVNVGGLGKNSPSESREVKFVAAESFSTFSTAIDMLSRMFATGLGTSYRITVEGSLAMR